MTKYNRKMRKSQQSMRELRKAATLSQRQLAALTGIDQSAISRIERGQRDVTVRQIKTIAKALKVPASVLIDDRL